MNVWKDCFAYDEMKWLLQETVENEACCQERHIPEGQDVEMLNWTGILCDMVSGVGAQLSDSSDSSEVRNNRGYAVSEVDRAPAHGPHR